MPKKHKLAGLMFSLIAGGMGLSGCASIETTHKKVTVQNYYHNDNYVIAPKNVDLTDGKTALFIIDMQQFFMDSISAKEMAVEKENILDMIQYFKKNEKQIFLFEYDAKGLRDMQGNPFVLGNTDEDILSELMDYDKTQTFKKKTDDAFRSTAINQTLRKLGIENVVLSGLNASACVLQTGNGAIKHGYNILTSTDIIMNPSEWTKGEGKNFYQKTAIFKKSYKDLIKLIEEDQIAENHPFYRFVKEND